MCLRARKQKDHSPKQERGNKVCNSKEDSLIRTTGGVFSSRISYFLTGGVLVVRDCCLLHLSKRIYGWACHNYILLP